MSETFAHRLPVTFADCDAAGIMFYPRVFEMVNRTVELWFGDALGCSFRTLHLDQHLSVPTARFEVVFHAPNRLEDLLDITLEVERLGRRSADLRIRFCGGEQLRVDVKQTIVLVDGRTMGSLAWPDDLRVRITPFLTLTPGET